VTDFDNTAWGNEMTPLQSAIAIGAVVIVVAVLVIAYLVSRQRRTAELRDRFGPEYDRTVEHYGSRGEAESTLLARTKRVERLEIRPLSERERSRYALAWREVQARFVDDPGATIGEADRLVNEVMKARGYPMGDFEQRAADISVDHAEVVEHYRAGHAAALRHDRSPLDTEELRQAFIHYRALFAALLEGTAGERTADAERRETAAEREAQERTEEVRR
jgi:hypothetical protein